MSYVLSIGEILGRFTTLNNNLIKDSNYYSFNYGGSEMNVLISLSSLGQECKFITRLPNNSLGLGAIDLLNKNLIDTSNIVLDEELNLGLYFLEKSSSERNSKVIYNRKNSAITNINIKDYNLKNLLKGASLFHFSGISLLLSPSLRKVIRECIKYAKEYNVPISFDFNYRKTLAPLNEALECYKDFIKDADYVFASVWDLKTFLEIDEEDERKIINKACDYYKYIFIKRREFIDSYKQRIVAECYSQNSLIQSKEYAFDYIDRIGSGDAYCAGILYGILNKLPLEKTLEYGIANLVLVQSIPLDYSTFKKADFDKYLANGKTDVSR